MKEVESMFSDLLDGEWDFMSKESQELADKIAVKIRELESR